MFIPPASIEEFTKHIRNKIELLYNQDQPIGTLNFLQKPLVDLLVYSQKITHQIATFKRVMLNFDF